MSAKVTVRTQMKDRAMIVEALKLMGVPDHVISVSDEGLRISGYQRKNWGKAQVLISKKFHDGYADVGFIRNGDTYDLCVDHIDTFRISNLLGAEGRKFEDLANQWYAAAVSQKTLKAQGFNTTIRKDGERLKVLATTPY